MAERDLLQLDPRVRFRSVDEEIGVLIHLERGTVVTMNAEALRTLDLIRRHGSRATVIAALADEHGTGAEEIEGELETFLRELREQGILA